MIKRTLVAVGALALPLAVSPATAWSTMSAAGNPRPLPPHADRAVCTALTGVAAARCFARVVTTPDRTRPLATSTYQSGYRPVDLQAAYRLSSTPSGRGSGPTVAIVDAYDNPNAQDDLANYRSQFSLPPLCNLSSSSPCVDFRKVNQTGGSRMPARNTGWGQEIDLDIEMVSAICPGCNVLLVEANSNRFADLGAAVDYAATQGVVAISNSYGSSGEFSDETSSTYNGPYDQPGIAVTASSGDSGYGVSFPAASNDVVAVGGTSLYRDSTQPSAARTSGGHTWSETVWRGAGSGCSAYFSRPDWQADYIAGDSLIPTTTTCSNRVVADVSAVADPSTGVAVYDSYGSRRGANWYVFGGTSVSSPIVAATYALAGGALPPYPAALAYSKPAGLFDVTAGSNGRCARAPKRSGDTANAYLCTAQAGYDGPTGLGTPNGAGTAF